MAHIVIIFCDDVARGEDFVYLAEFGGLNAAMVAFQKVFRPWGTKFARVRSRPVQIH